MKIKVLLKEPYKEAEVKEIEDKLANWQKLVGGYIQCLPAPFDDTMDIVCNEEGKLMHLDGNFFLPEYDDFMCGSVAFVSFTKDGEFSGLNEKQIEKAKEYVKDFQLEEGEDLYEQFDILNVRAKLKMKEKQDSMQ